MNKKLSIHDFLLSSDLLFSKKIEQVSKEEIEIFKSQYSNLQLLFNSEKERIRKMINIGSEQCIQLIRDEIKRCEDNEINL